MDNLEERVKKGFEEAADEVIRYFGWDKEKHMENSKIGSYKILKDEDVIKYKEMLKKPNIDFPHYEHLIIDGKVVYQYSEEKLLSNEMFLEDKYLLDNFNIKLEISNYGRVKMNGKIKLAEVNKDIKNTFKHGLVIYLDGYGLKSIHRLIKETFDPIIGMEIKGKYQVHHLNNNGNDNRLENLIWVTIEDHKRIDSEFNMELKKIGEIIRKNKQYNSPNVI